MTDHLNLIRIKLRHLSRISEYLAYSLSQVESVLKLKDWAALSPDQHESLAAFRVRLGEFQEHLGKTMRAVAIEEEQDVERFGSVLAYMERLNLIDSADHWKLIRVVGANYLGQGRQKSQLRCWSPARHSALRHGPQ